jgi:membrane protease YdiL (CAAX protease family)
VGVIAALLVFFFLQAVLTGLLGTSPVPAAATGPATDPATSTAPGPPAPGSAAWHRQNLTGSAALLGAAGFMAALLYVTRPRDRAAARWPWISRAGAVLGTTLALLPITTAQQRMGEVVWHWLRPSDAPPMHEVLRALHESAWGHWGVVQLVVGAVVVAPMVEELFFRGVVLNALCLHLRRAWVAVVTSAVAFGCVHAQPQDILPLVTMGVVLGYLRLRVGSVWVCVAVHALFNARMIVFALAAPELLEQHG